MDIFIKILIAHIVGEFFLQPRGMAVKKYHSSWMCSLHCVLYTAPIVFATWDYFNGVDKAIWAIWIFAGHFIVDRLNLPDLFLRVTGRSPVQFLEGQERHSYMTEYETRHLYLEAAFSAISYKIMEGFFYFMIIIAGSSFI